MNVTTLTILSSPPNIHLLAIPASLQSGIGYPHTPTPGNGSRNQVHSLRYSLHRRVRKRRVSQTLEISFLFHSCHYRRIHQLSNSHSRGHAAVCDDPYDDPRGQLEPPRLRWRRTVRLICLEPRTCSSPIIRDASTATEASHRERCRCGRYGYSTCAEIKRTRAVHLAWSYPHQRSSPCGCCLTCP